MDQSDIQPYVMHVVIYIACANEETSMSTPTPP